MSRADELLPIPPAANPRRSEGMELTDEHRAQLDIEERFVPGLRALLMFACWCIGPKARAAVCRYSSASTVGFVPCARTRLRRWMRVGDQPRMRLVSVDYRLRPKIRSCRARRLLRRAVWVAQNADALAIDIDRLVVKRAAARAVR